MTRREVQGRIRHLERGRDRIVRRLGKLTVEAPDFGLGATTATGAVAAGGGAANGGLNTKVLGEEMKRVLQLVSETSLGSFEESDSTSSPPALASVSSPTSFLPLLTQHLSLPPPSPNPPSHLTRPSNLTRLWPPLLLLPVLLPLLAPYVPALRNGMRDAKKTAQGFWKGWVIEPLMGIIDTVRHGGGEGAGSGLSVMSKEGMKGDMEVSSTECVPSSEGVDLTRCFVIMQSLERMVVSLAQDKRSYTPVELANLTQRVREGDLTDVLKLYEDDIKVGRSSLPPARTRADLYSFQRSPLSGPPSQAPLSARCLFRSRRPRQVSCCHSSLRVLLTTQLTSHSSSYSSFSQVDVDLALSGIDKLLRSQELTFAFVGVAPSFLIVYLLGGWFRALLSQAGAEGFSVLGGRGSKGQRKRKSWRSIRCVLAPVSLISFPFLESHG